MKNLKLIVVGMLALSASGTSFASEDGVYMVPKSTYLEGDLFLTAENVSFRKNEDGIMKLDYRLPKELDGKHARKIVLKSKIDAPDVLIGEDGSATCEVFPDGTLCKINYFLNEEEIFPINVEAANDYIATQNYSRATVDLLGKGQQSIMHEAAGELFIKNRH